MHLRSLLAIGPLLGLTAAALAAPAAPVWDNAADIPKSEAVVLKPAGTSPADITRFLMVRKASRPSLSPDGTRLAYRTSTTGVPQIWVVDTTGGAPRQITFGGGVTDHLWAPDGKSILYGADNAGDERETYRLISADGTSEHRALPFTRSFTAIGDFSSDGGQVVFSSTERNGRDFDVYVTDLGTGSTRMVLEGRFGFFARGWQPGGDLVVVAETRGEDAVDVHLLDVASGKVETIFAPDVAANYSGFAWLPDGSGFYVATDQDRDFAGLAFYDLGARELSFIETPDFDVGNVAISGDGRYLAWTTNEDGFSRLHVHDRGEENSVAVAGLPDGVFRLTWARQAPVLAIEATGPGLPGDIWTWDGRRGETRRATRSATAGLDMAALVSPESVRFEARDGVGLHGLLYLPRDGAAKPPVVMRVHGGPTAQARPVFRPVVQYLVGKGIAVLDVNVRGSTGFGKTFARLDNQRLRPNAVRDLVDALAWLGDDGRVDAGRAAVMGGSYGGYMVNAVLGEYSDAFVAAVSYVGVSDWVRALEGASPALKASDRVEYGDITDADDRAFFTELSPITRAGRIKVPMLVEHGANDPRDPVTESDRLVKMVRASGVEVEYLRFADEGHNVRKLSNRVTLYRRVADFLERHLIGGDREAAAR